MSLYDISNSMFTEEKNKMEELMNRIHLEQKLDNDKLLISIKKDYGQFVKDRLLTIEVVANKSNKWMADFHISIDNVKDEENDKKMLGTTFGNMSWKNIDFTVPFLKLTNENFNIMDIIKQADPLYTFSDKYNLINLYTFTDLVEILVLEKSKIEKSIINWAKETDTKDYSIDK